MHIDIRLITIVCALILLGCENPTPTSKPTIERKQEVAKPEPTAQEVKKFKKPAPGKVAEFFTAYGNENPETRIRLKTRLGDIEIELFEDTPLHRANFIYNIKNELYHKTIFYRVVPEFMIQGGNSDYDQTIDKREEAGAYYIPNETTPNHIHRRGAIAMAMSYEDNPKLKSAQYSYYIVIGKKFDEKLMKGLEKEYQVSVPAGAREIYRAVGGTPHLDGVHTVFGQVISGMDVVEAIANEKRDSGDWPVNDVIIEYEILE